MENYKERENNIINCINILAEMNRTLRLQCKSFICDFVKEYGKENGDGSFSLSLYDDEVGEYLGEQNICCTYDGGNHPEYAANPYSTINAIKYEDGNIFLDTEDVDKYDSSYIPTDEVISIAEYLMDIKDELDENRTGED